MKKCLSILLGGLLLFGCSELQEPALKWGMAIASLPQILPAQRLILPWVRII